MHGPRIPSSPVLRPRIPASAPRRHIFPSDLSASLRCEAVRIRHSVSYHFHPEYELHFGTYGQGIRIAGDNMERCGGEVLTLIGPSLPHGLVLAPAAAAATTTLLVITFTRDSLGPDLLAKPELREIDQLLDQARRGLDFSSSARDRVRADFARLARGTDAERLALLLLILARLAADPGRRPLASAAYEPRHAERDCALFERALTHLHQSPERVPDLRAMAARLRISVSTFTRLFRRMSGCSYVQYVNHWRIGRARALLASTDQQITGVAFAVGYTNLSHFNRQFRRLVRSTPRAYRHVQRRLGART